MVVPHWFQPTPACATTPRPLTTPLRARGEMTALVVAAAVVENTHHVAVADATLARIVGMHFQDGFAFQGLQAGHVHETGVEKVARRWRNWPRIALGCSRRLVVGHMVGTGSRPRVARRSLAISQRPGWRGKPPAQTGASGHFTGAKPCCSSCSKSTWAGKGFPTHGCVILLEAGFQEPHPERQLAKNLRVGFGLAQRRNGGLVEQDIRCGRSSGGCPVLELRGGGWDVVGIVGGVGLKCSRTTVNKSSRAKPRTTCARLGRYRHQVAVVSHHGYRWPEC